MKRILLVANKNWEVESVLSALLNAHIRPSSLSNPDILNYPWKYTQGNIAPRAVWNSFLQTTIELWCVQDIMESKWNPSSSQGKKSDLPNILAFGTQPPDLVMALGTGGFGSPVDNNIGSVVLGSNIFIHNFHPGNENPDSGWDDPVHFEKLLTSSIDRSFFQLIDSPTMKMIESRLLKPFLNPSSDIHVLNDPDFVGLSSVNITKSAEYAVGDQAGMQAISEAGIQYKVGSVETTHGIIRILTEAPFAFITGIVNRLGHFDTDVLGTDNRGNVKLEAQNFSAAFNLGAYLSYLIPLLPKFVNK